MSIKYILHVCIYHISHRDILLDYQVIKKHLLVYHVVFHLFKVALFRDASSLLNIYSQNGGALVVLKCFYQFQPIPS